MQLSLKYFQNRIHIWESYGLHAFCLTLFLMTYPRSWVLYALGAFLVFNLLLWMAEFRQNLDFLKNKLYFIIPFAAYFLLYLFCAIFQEAGWSYIEKRLMFILIPLLGIPVLRSILLNRKLGIVIISFVAGIFSASMILLMRAALIGLEIIDKPSIPVNTIDIGYSNYFSSFLTFFQHPAYFSMTLNLAVVFLIIFKEEIKISNMIRIPLLLFFLIFIYLISSRAGILACGISLTCLLYIRLSALKPGKLFHILFPSAIVLVFIMIVFLNPRISVTIKEITDKLFTNESVELKDLEPRTRVWYSSIQLIKEHPLFGVGIKELDQKLVQEYRRNSFYEEAFFTLNAHNQFLETQLTFGITGTILLIWMLFAPLLRKRSILNITLYTSFLIIIIIHFLFESMLVRQWGIMFFVLFSCLQVFIKEKPSRNKVETK